MTEYRSTTQGIADLLGSVQTQAPVVFRVLHPHGPPVGTTTLCVVVSPATAAGLHAAAAMISTWRPHLPQPGLVVVRDSPLRPPRIVAQRVHTLLERVRFSVQVDLPRLAELDHPVHALHEGSRREVARLRGKLEALRSQCYAATFLAAGGGLPGPVPDLAVEPPVPAPDQLP
ncbi:hypothetical protein [Nocardiopsis dassonvillei]|uniref:hypothetical protein n=1 Tax=Nocardiopsis dassonvillei TaxID=2014 RepID=UPI00340BAA88